MEQDPTQPLELHCQAIVHLAPGTFEIRGGGKQLFINTLQSPKEDELMRLRTENDALRQQVSELQRQLAAPAHTASDATPVSPTAIAAAIVTAYDGWQPLTATDWVAAYHVLTTLALAPKGYSAFSAWANALELATLPPCSASLLSKANPIYMKPLARWASCDAVRPNVIARRLAIAHKLNALLAPCLR